MVTCLGGKTVNYKKGESIILACYPTKQPGIVISGSLEAVKYSSDGVKNIISIFFPSSIFSDILPFSKSSISPVTITATEDSKVLFLEYKRMISPCFNACGKHSMLIENLLRTISSKYFDLNKKIEYLSTPSLRGKISKYLKDTMKSTGSATFNIPLDRSSLADYLNADRSALSRELSRMKNDGIIQYYKNSFKILDAERL